MSFKTKPENLSFTDLEFFHKKFKNRTIRVFERIEKELSWRPIESILEESYPIGHKKRGNAAYPPLMLFKCHLLKQWFKIKSDVELEGLINDRISFKNFTGLALLDKSPDSSTFSRFRKRISPKRLSLLTRKISKQLREKKLDLRKGSSADVRVVKSPKKTSKKKRAAKN